MPSKKCKYGKKKDGYCKKSRVSMKISKLVDEGYPQKQAVAIALSMDSKNQIGPKGEYKMDEQNYEFRVSNKLCASGECYNNIDKDSKSILCEDCDQKLSYNYSMQALDEVILRQGADFPPPPPRLVRQRAMHPDLDANEGVAVDLRRDNVPHVRARDRQAVEGDPEIAEQVYQEFLNLKCSLVRRFKDAWNNQLFKLWHSRDQANERMDSIINDIIDHKYLVPDVNLNRFDKGVRTHYNGFMRYNRINFINVLLNTEGAVVYFNRIYRRDDCLEEGEELFAGVPGHIVEDDVEEDKVGFNYRGGEETIKFTRGKSKGETLRFKKGTLRKSLHMEKDETFTMDEIDRLSRISIGDRFDFHGRHYTMDRLMKRRVDLAKTLMGFHHRYNMGNMYQYNLGEVIPLDNFQHPGGDADLPPLPLVAQQAGDPANEIPLNIQPNNQQNQNNQDEDEDEDADIIFFDEAEGEPMELEDEAEPMELGFNYRGGEETIKFTRGKSKGETLRFKKGTLRKSLHMKKDETFSMDEIDRLSRISIGDRFDFHGRHYTMDHLMKRRVDLAKTLMGFHHRYNMDNIEAMESEFNYRGGEETIKFTRGKSKGKSIKFKKGALRRQLRMKDGDTFTKSEMSRLSKIKNGKSFNFHGNKFKMTPKMKKRINLAKTLMGFHHRYNMNESPKLEIGGHIYRPGFITQEQNIISNGLDNLPSGWEWKVNNETLNLKELTYNYKYGMGSDIFLSNRLTED